MQFRNLENQENKTATFVVESDAAEFDKAVNSAYLQQKGRISIPGFRKGKAPRTVVEGMYGPDVFYQDALDELAPAAFSFGLQESALKTVGAPAIKDVEVTEEKTAVYTFQVTLYPQAELGQYKGLESVRVVEEVTDEMVEKEIEAVRKRNSRMLPVEREAQNGDTANIDFEGFLDGEAFEGGKGESYSLELGSGSFVPGFEEQVVGMNVGEEKDIDVTFPADYVENLAGKAVVFHVKLNGLTCPELPELDDDFAQDVSEFNTLDEYKADLKANLEKTAADDTESGVKSRLVASAIENMKVELPECMLTEKMEEIVRNYAANFGLRNNDISFEELCKMMGLDQEQLNLTIRPAAEFQVKNEVLLNAVAQAEGIEISAEEVDAFAEKIAGTYQGTTAEQVKMYFGEDFIKGEAAKDKALAVIVDSAVLKDVTREEYEAQCAAELEAKKAAEAQE